MLESAEDVMRAELRSGEKLLWAGKPRSGLVLRPLDAFLIPFSLMWCGFVVFWEVMVIAHGAPLFFALWGIPFVLMGIFVVVGRFVVDAKQRQHTYYGLTTETVIIVSGLVRRTVKSLALRGLADTSLTERRNGSGDIEFGSLGAFGPWAWMFGAAWFPGIAPYGLPRFERIENARRVYELIRQVHGAQR
jgi:hypothetical protein